MNDAANDGWSCCAGSMRPDKYGVIVLKAPGQRGETFVRKYADVCERWVEGRADTHRHRHTGNCFDTGGEHTLWARKFRLAVGDKCNGK